MSRDSNLTLDFPSGSVNGSVLITIQTLISGGPSPPTTQQLVTPAWLVTAMTVFGQHVGAFNKPISVVVHYQAVAPQFIADWDGQEWVNLVTVVDTSSHTASASTPQPSELAGVNPVSSQQFGLPPLVPTLAALLGICAVAVATYFARTSLPVSQVRIPLG